MPELLSPGERINDRLIVLEEIGRGARGVVYKAYDPRLARNVALKLIRSSYDAELDAVVRRRLIKEAQAMAQLEHPRVVSAYDVGIVEREGGAQVFVEMQYVDGISLREQLQRWREDPRWRSGGLWKQIVAVFLDAGEGLAAAHERRLVHRDFKPANVLLDGQGRAQVTDFGLVRRLVEDPLVGPEQTSESGRGLEALDVALTQTGALVGTPAYMAPERFSGGGEDDARVDQFAFCVALWEALYGARPFLGEDAAQLARAVLQDPPQRPPGAPSMPGFVHRALMRGLSKVPEERFANMHELLAALRRDRRASTQRIVATGLALAGLAGIAYGVNQAMQPGAIDVRIAANMSELELRIDEALVEPSELDEGSARLQLELPPGRHALQVSARNYESAQLLFEVERGVTYARTLALQPAQGTMELDVSSGEASLYLDGSTQELFRSVEVGRHTLRVAQAGAHEVRLEFEVQLDEVAELTAHLAPAIAYERAGGGLPLGAGTLGRAADGTLYTWEFNAGVLTVDAPMQGRVVWERRASDDGHAVSLRVLELDGDGLGDPVILGVEDGRASLRALDGRSGELLWRVSPELANERPLVPPVPAEVEGRPRLLVSSLEPNVLVAYDGPSGEQLWRRPFEGPGFGLVAGSDWAALAHTGGISVFEVEGGERLWFEPIAGFGPELVEQMRSRNGLENIGRYDASSWMLVAELDGTPGEELVFAAPQTGREGKLLALDPARKEQLWTGEQVHWDSPRSAGDLDGDGIEELTAQAPDEKGETVSLVLDGHTGKRADIIDKGEMLVRWPCEGPGRLLHPTAEGVAMRTYARALDDGVRVLPGVPAAELYVNECLDWDGDGGEELVLLTKDRGVRVVGSEGEQAAIAMDRIVDGITPLGDLDSDARPDFLLRAAGPTVALGSRIRWARRLAAELPAAPVVEDFDGDGQRELAIFDGQQDTARLELLAARDGRRLAASEEGLFALHAPALVEGLTPGTHDLLFPSSPTRVVRVLGSDFSVVDLGHKVESYAPLGVSPDARQMWVVSYEAAPYLRQLLAPETDAGPWALGLRLDAEYGSVVEPRFAQLDGDTALELVAVLDRSRVVVLDSETGACQWSRWTTHERLGRGPLITELDGDDIDDLVVASVPGAEPSPECTAGPRAAAQSDPSLELVALDGGTGSLLWRADAGSTRTSPVRLAHEGWLASFADRPGAPALVALDPSDGQQRWSLSLEARLSTALAVGDLDADGREELVLGDERGVVSVVDAATGTLRWVWTPQVEAPQKAPVALEDLDGDGHLELLVASGAGTLFVLEGDMGLSPKPD